MDIKSSIITEIDSRLEKLEEHKDDVKKNPIILIRRLPTLFQR